MVNVKTVEAKKKIPNNIIYRIEKYTSRNTICPDEKFAGTSTSSNINQPLDFFKLFLTDKLTNEIVRETNNYARKKLEEKLG